VIDNMIIEKDQEVIFSTPNHFPCTGFILALEC
jgi:hypothetical protein